MTIDDLERLEASLRKFRLVDLLNAYSAEVPNRLASLSHFLAANPDKFPLYHSESLASSTKAILEESIRRIFPDKKWDTGGVNEVVDN